MKKRLFFELISFIILLTLILSADSYGQSDFNKPVPDNVKHYLKFYNELREYGKYQRAEEGLKKCAVYLKRNGNKYWLGLSYQYLGMLYAETHQTSKALEFLKSSKKLFFSLHSSKYKGNQRVVDEYISRLEKGTANDNTKIETDKHRGEKKSGKDEDGNSNGLNKVMQSFNKPVENNEIIDEINLARTQPRMYMKYILALKKTGGDIRIGLTEEGCVDEAVRFLERQDPIQPLKLSIGLVKAAIDFCNDAGPKGIEGHVGSNGSTVFTRIGKYLNSNSYYGENIDYSINSARNHVIRLIVDSNVPSRGHRANIFNRNFNFIGCASGKHQKYQQMHVLDFSADGD